MQTCDDITCEGSRPVKKTNGKCEHRNGSPYCLASECCDFKKAYCAAGTNKFQCSSNYVLKTNAENVKCKHGECDTNQCCDPYCAVGTNKFQCSATSSNFLLKTNAENVKCEGACTLNQCCDRKMRCSTHFRESGCPAGRAKKDENIQCAGTECTDDECCKEALKESERDTCDKTQTKCPSAPYYSKKAQPPTCAGLTCEREECCTRNYRCGEKGTEVKGKCTDLKKSFYPGNFCNGDTCTGDSCCGTRDCTREPPCKTTKEPTCDDANKQPKPISLWASCCFEKSTDCMAAVRCKAGELVKPTIEWACTNASISQTATEEAKRAAAKTCYDNVNFDSSKDCISENAFEAEKANEQNAKAEDFNTKYDTCWKAQQAAGVDVKEAKSECWRKTQTENSVKTEDIEANAQKKAMEAATSCTKSVTECQADTKKSTGRQWGGSRQS
jgi:hypothetical protein